MTEVRRYKRISELTTDELVKRGQSLRHGKPEPQFETDEYREARRKALEAAGLDADDDEPKPVEEMTAADHLERIQRK